MGIEGDAAAAFEQVSEIEPTQPTLIEGLPGHGLVASIAVDQITTQLDLDHYGNITADEFPPVVTFEDGVVQDLVRVYAGDDPAVMTLHSDLALPPESFGPLSDCVLTELSDSFDRAIFLAGAPAESEEQLGDVRGIATTSALRHDLADAGIDVAEERGVVGGVTGALVRACYRADVPATLLVVRSHPNLPDPGAAMSVIETALEPLVDFDIDTSELDERAGQIRQQMQQVAKQYEEAARGDEGPEPPTQGMYQ